MSRTDYRTVHVSFRLDLPTFRDFAPEGIGDTALPIALRRGLWALVHSAISWHGFYSSEEAQLAYAVARGAQRLHVEVDPVPGWESYGAALALTSDVERASQDEMVERHARGGVEDAPC